MPRISLDPPRTPLVRLLSWYSRRRFGTEIDPGLAMAHNRRVLIAALGQDLLVRRLDQVDPGLKTLATLGTAALIGCSWCVDFGYWEGLRSGLAPEKVRDIARWRESSAYTELERLVLAYAEAISGHPVAVTDDLVAELRERLDEAQLVELTMMVSVENSRCRFNSALGLSSQGFRDRCRLPAATA